MKVTLGLDHKIIMGDKSLSGISQCFLNTLKPDTVLRSDIIVVLQ